MRGHHSPGFGSLLVQAHLAVSLHVVPHQLICLPVLTFTRPCGILPPVCATNFSIVAVLCLDFTCLLISLKIFLVSACCWWKNFLSYCIQPWLPACSPVLLAYWFHRFELHTTHCAPKQKKFLKAEFS